MGRLPHPIPYQGSKRLLAGRILDVLGDRRFARLFEPFAGSAAVTIAARERGIARDFVLGDSLSSLVALWRRIIEEPEAIVSDYEQIWLAQLTMDRRRHYARVRRAFNRDADPAKLLYLLARCVKSAPRFNAAGEFNQSADHRRLGTHPEKMRREITAASELLRGATTTTAGDFTRTLAEATPRDLVYLDPPWHGTSTGRDKRYHQPLGRERLISALRELNARGISWLLSYDGRHGEHAYAPPLPDDLGAARLELLAGRSSQATLHGRSTLTVESLYVSIRHGYNDAPCGRLPRLRAISSVG